MNYKHLFKAILILLLISISVRQYLTAQSYGGSSLAGANFGLNIQSSENKATSSVSPASQVFESDRTDIGSSVFIARINESQKVVLGIMYTFQSLNENTISSNTPSNGVAPSQFVFESSTVTHQFGIMTRFNFHATERIWFYIQPALSGGFGTTDINDKSPVFNGTQTSVWTRKLEEDLFLFQASINPGISYFITPKTSLDLRYGIFGLTSISSKGTTVTTTDTGVVVGTAQDTDGNSLELDTDFTFDAFQFGLNFYFGSYGEYVEPNEN